MSQISLLYSYVSQSVYRRNDLCDNERLLPAGGSLAKISQNGKAYWYRRFYDGDGQHSECLGEESKVADLIARERELMQRDAYIADYLLSMRNMEFPMPPIGAQKAMRRLARAGFLKLAGVVRVDVGVANSYAAMLGDPGLAREANAAFKRSGILEFHVQKDSLRKARKILKALPEIPVKIVNAPDYLIDFVQPEVFLCVPGIAMDIPDANDFIKFYKDNFWAQKLIRKLEKALAKPI